VDPVDLATEVEDGNGHRIRKKRKGERHAQTVREKEQNPFKTTEIKDERSKNRKSGKNITPQSNGEGGDTPVLRV
jgi:hypothetical protein